MAYRYLCNVMWVQHHTEIAKVPKIHYRNDCPDHHTACSGVWSEDPSLLHHDSQLYARSNVIRTLDKEENRASGASLTSVIIQRESCIESALPSGAQNHRGAYSRRGLVKGLLRAGGGW
eukprot:746671-Hanusia_phi.AAC.2